MNKLYMRCIFEEHHENEWINDINTDINHNESPCTVEKEITGYCLNAAVLTVFLLLALHLSMDHWSLLIHPGMRYLMRLVTKKINPTCYVHDHGLLQ